MFWIFLLLGIAFVVIIFVFKVIIKKAIRKYRLQRNKKRMEKILKYNENRKKQLEIKWISNRFIIPKKCRQKINQKGVENAKRTNKFSLL